ncbi:hypothetical protein MMC21_000345 [Puttea exsequens]|nr:hypothetical protein [Puttea exsequens]
MIYEHDPAISEFEHEKHRPREAEALRTLRKVASLVKPIMRQRGWHVRILTEFYPEEKNLLGLNHNRGQKICLRLRHAGDERQFLPLEQVTDTMLHELCHIVFGPHDEHFHRLWDQLRNEYEALLRKGYTGEGFLSQGYKLGGGRIPMHEARRRARASAEKRKVLSAGSGQKLGGAPVKRGQDIRKVIVDAVERRATITKGCSGSGMSKDREVELVQETNKNGFRTKAEEDDADELAIMTAYIDLVQEDEREKWGNSYVPPSKENPTGSQGGPSKPKQGYQAPSAKARSSPNPPILSTTKPRSTSSIPTRTKPPSPQPSPPQRQPSQTWTCDICTLVNPSTYLVCDACSTERPLSSFSKPTSSLSPQAPQQPRRTATTPSTQAIPTSIRDSNAKKAVKSIMSLEATMSKQPSKPIGWICSQCDNFMESEWWTCARCGAMKAAS